MIKDNRGLTVDISLIYYDGYTNCIIYFKADAHSQNMQQCFVQSAYYKNLTTNIVHE